MQIIGITGSIGMGKSTVAGMFSQLLRCPVYDADRAVHNLFKYDKIVQAHITQHYPSAVIKNQVNRPLLGKLAFNNPTIRRDLEQLLHPLLARQRQRLLQHWQRQRCRAAILDIPLLFETGIDQQCNYTVLVECPAWLQTQRVLQRPNMTLEKLNNIRKAQWPVATKRKLADVCVVTGLSTSHTRRQVVMLARRWGLCCEL